MMLFLLLEVVGWLRVLVEGCVMLGKSCGATAHAGRPNSVSYSNLYILRNLELFWFSMLFMFAPSLYLHQYDIEIITLSLNFQIFTWML